jgi:gluconate 2-dehydrogenase gamma chain
MKRREFLTLPAKALGGVLIYSLRGEPLLVQESKDTLRIPLRFFSEREANVISLACERIFPSDESGPGAGEAGVVIYIDRQLAGPYGRDKYRYTKGPFRDSLPEHGYQGGASPRAIYRAGLQQLDRFSELSTAEQDARLRAIESTLFFQMLRAHTIEGMFCDPMHGGNQGLIGWQLIGFPGPHMSYRLEVDRHYGQAWRPKPMSLKDVLGQVVEPWEDEKE